MRQGALDLFSIAEESGPEDILLERGTETANLHQGLKASWKLTFPSLQLQAPTVDQLTGLRAMKSHEYASCNDCHNLL